MRLLTGSWLAPLGFALVAACSHSDPTGPWFPPEDGPLGDEVPTRLTYSVGTDVWPNFSQDGSHLIYTFELGTPDRDRCLGVLPGRGGQRKAEVCASTVNQTSSRDGFEHGNLSARGLLAYTKHSGSIGGPTASLGALYVAPIDSLAGERKVFDLLQIVPGASRIWDYLLNPVWISDNELAFIGAQVDYIPPVPFAPEDTVYTGLDLAKVRIDGGAPTVTVLADLGNAQALAWDPSLARFAFLRNDSVFTVPVTGGTPAFFFELIPEPGTFGHAITGLAAGGGKLWITWIHAMDPGTQTTLFTSSISEIGTGGTLTTLTSRERLRDNSQGSNVSNEGTWERIAASPDGARLVVEGRNGPTGDDIYLLELP